MANPNRYCDACGHDHGPLYLCPHYDVATKAFIHRAQVRFGERRTQVSLKEWLGVENWERDLMESDPERDRKRPQFGRERNA